MSRSKRDYSSEAKYFIKEDKDIINVTDVCFTLGISRLTFYNHIPAGSKDFLEIQSLLNHNKYGLKKELRKKWRESESPQTQMYLYRLIASKEELSRLVNNQVLDSESNQTETKTLTDDQALNWLDYYKGKDNKIYTQLREQYPHLNENNEK